MKNNFILFLLLFSSLIFSQEKKNLVIKKTIEKITIDGLLDETVWKISESANDFWQNFPYDTCLAKSKTEVFMTYNDKSIFIAAICYDSIPGNYIIQSLKRDFSYPISDAFVVTLDPFSDQQNGFSFGVNPFGVQREGLIANGGGMGVTTAWDNKWYAEVKRNGSNWTVEIEIPFKSIRFKPELSNWKINFARNDLKRNENSTWNKVPRQFNIASLAFSGELIWDNIPKKTGNNIAIIPYSIAKSTKDFVTKTDTKYDANIGLDGKIGLSSSMNLDLTLNPDFSQVEVDRQITNLTRFNLMFPEQRQFFIENSDLFASFGFRQMRPFFSRRIGIGSTNLIPIIAGARLSGKPNKNWRIGLMDIQTAKTKDKNIDVFAQNYMVAAIQRNVFKRSNIAMIFVNRQQFDTNKYSITNFNRVLGLDYNLASADNKWNGKFFFHHSFSHKNNNDAYSHASWLNYSTQKIMLIWNHEYMNKNYNAETGFTPRLFQTDLGKNITTRNTYWRLEPSFNYFIYPKNSIINKMGPKLYLDYYANNNFTTTDVLAQVGYDINLTNTSGILINYNTYYTKLIYPTDVTFSGITSIPANSYNYRDVVLSFKSNQRKILNATFSGSYGSYFTGNKISYNTEITFRKQPYAIIGLNYTHNEITLPNINKVILDLVGPRIELSFSRSLFFTTFLQYNSQIKNFNINTRLQYRFNPMSDIFIVYSDNYVSENFNNKNKALVLKFVYWFN